MIYKILISLAGLFALVRLFKTTDNFARAIMAAQISAIALTLLPEKTLNFAGLALFMVSLAMVIIYGFVKKEIPSVKQILISGSAFLLLLTLTFQMQHWPGAGILGLTLAIPAIAIITQLITHGGSYKNEMGFLLVIAFASGIEFARRIVWLLN
jgi:voltage-gated potassium channel Kch